MSYESCKTELDVYFILHIGVIKMHLEMNESSDKQMTGESSVWLTDSKFKIIIWRQSSSTLQALIYNLHGHLFFLLRIEWYRKLHWLLLRSLSVLKSLWFCLHVHHFFGVWSLVINMYSYEVLFLVTTSLWTLYWY